MVNILTLKASDNVIIEDISTTEVGPPTPLCLSKEQASVSGGVHSRSVGESTEDSSLIEKEMPVLDVIEDSGDQGDSKDIAMASSTGEAQVLMVEESVQQGTLPLDTVPVLSTGTCTEKEELPAQMQIEEKVFLAHMASEVEDFPALINIEVKEFPVQTPTEDQEFSFKTRIEVMSLAQTTNEKEELPAQIHTDTEGFLVLTPAGKEELLAQTCIENKEFSSREHLQNDGFPVQTHLKKAKLPPQICIEEEELPAQTQSEKIEFPIPTHIKEEEYLSQAPDKMDRLPARTPTETEEFLALTSTAVENKDHSAQSHTEKNGFSAQIHLIEAKCRVQNCIEEEEFSVEQEEFPVQTYAEEMSAQKYTNYLENKDVEVIEFPVTEAEGDLVGDEAFPQLSEDDKIPEEMHREINADAKVKEYIFEKSQPASQESVAPINEECISPDEKDKSTGCERCTPSKKSVSFCEDAKCLHHKPRQNSKIYIYESASSPISKQEWVKTDEGLLSVAVHLMLPCEEDHILQEEVEEKNIETLLCETKEEEKYNGSEYGQKDESEVEEVLQEVTKMKQEVNTVSATAL